MNQQRLINFLIDKAVFGLVLFCIFIGSLVASVNSETLRTMPTAQRYVTQMAGFVVVVLITGYLVSTYNWNPYALCGIGLFLGMGSVKLSLWLFALWKESNDFTEFLSNITRVVQAFLKTYRDIQDNPKDNDKPDH